jgi:hypothetical protein
METVEVVLPEVGLLPPTEAAHGEQLIAAARDVLVQGHKYSVEIKDADQYGKGVLFAQDLDRQIKELKKEREKIVSPLHQAHKNATSFFNRLLEPREQMKAAIENAATRFRLEQDRLRRLEEERQAAIEKLRRELNEAHDSAFTEDNQRLVHFLKQWDDAINADEDRTRAIERKKEEDARLEHAKVAEEVGNTAGVSAILGTPMPLAPAPVILSTVTMAAAIAPAAMLAAPDLTPPAPAAPPAPPPPVTKVPTAGDPPSFVPEIKGVSTGVKWKFKVMSKRKLVEAILNDHFPMDAITIEDGPMGPIGTKVSKLKGACVEEYKAYGIEVWPEANDKIRAV